MCRKTVVFTAFALISSLLLGGCDRVVKEVARQVVGATSPEIKAPELAKISEQEASAFATALLSAVEAADSAAIEKQVDFATLTKRALAGAHLPTKVLTDTEAGLATGARQQGFVAQLAGLNAQKTAFSLLGTRADGKLQWVSFRALPEPGGVEHYDFLLSKRADGSVAAVDIYFMTAGETVSESTRRVLLPMFASDKSFVERLGEDENLFVKHLAEILKAQKAMSAGAPEESLEVLDALPDALKNQKFALLMRMRAASANTDDPRYAQILDTLLQKFPDDPAAAVASIDHFFLKKQFDRALASIALVEKSVTPDPYFGVIRVAAYSEMGKLDKAKQAALDTIEREPGLLPAHFALVGVLLAQKDHPATAAELLKMHEQFGLEYSLDEVPEYAAFVASKEYPELERALEPKPE